MDGLKCKKTKVGNKKYDLLIKLQKKVKKRRKRNYKKLNNAPKTWQPTVQKTLGRLRVKGRERVEGMFSKGLRSEYIKRNTFNEVNEARKNEDLHKIIDIGRVFLQKRELPEKFSKRLTICTNSQKPEKSPVLFRKATNKTFENFDRCSLSPISFWPFWKDYSQEEEDREARPIKNFKLDFDKEFEEFSRKYEKTVGAQVLLRLPEDGVLEDALKVLRKMRILREDEPEREEYTIKGLRFDFNFLTQNLETESDKIFGNIFSPEKSLLPEIKESFVEKPLEGELIMTDVNVENYYHPSFTPGIENDDDESESPPAFRLQEKNFEKPTKHLSILTPQIQFYRRNMF